MRTFLGASLLSLTLAACAGDPPQGDPAVSETLDGGSVTSERVSGGCVITGCNDQICSDQRVSTACVSSAQNACFALTTCGRGNTGGCTWRSSDELNLCLARAATSGGATTTDTSMRSSGSGLGAPPPGSDPEPTNPSRPGNPSDGCMKTGAFAEICADRVMDGATEYDARFACYQTTVCERQPGGECGFTPTFLSEGCLWLVMNIDK